MPHAIRIFAAALLGLLLPDASSAAAPDVEAQLRQAHASAHQGRFDEARAAFQAVLTAQPERLEALTGLGYAQAWDGQLEEAAATFRRVEALSPGNLEAEKGLAYVALWGGRHREAARRFEALGGRLPADPEPLVGRGQALAAAGRRAEAHDAFARALALQPGREDAQRGLRDTAPRGPGAQLLLLGGYTRTDGHGELGLRFAEAAVEPAEGWRAWIQYDDSLSLDNVALARGAARASAWYLGGRRAWADGLATRLELGYRSLPGRVDQGLLRAEQEAGLGGAAVLKVGGWLGPRSDDRLEASAHAGVSLALGRRLRVEPVLFLARSGVAGESELRGLLAAEWAFPAGATLGGGVSAGRAWRPAPQADGSPVGAFARAGLPLGRGWSGQALVSQERPAGGPSVTLFALGLSATLGGRP